MWHPSLLGQGTSCSHSFCRLIVFDDSLSADTPAAACLPINGHVLSPGRFCTGRAEARQWRPCNGLQTGDKAGGEKRHASHIFASALALRARGLGGGPSRREHRGPVSLLSHLVRHCPLCTCLLHDAHPSAGTDGPSDSYIANLAYTDLNQGHAQCAGRRRLPHRHSCLTVELGSRRG